jgi:hypothetical protein
MKAFEIGERVRFIGNGSRMIGKIKALGKTSADVMVNGKIYKVIFGRLSRVPGRVPQEV